MSRTGCVVMDLHDIVGRLNDTGRFDPAVIESWLARLYCKNYSIPCVSMRLFDFREKTVPYERMRLTLTAQRLGIDPLDYLPPPERNWKDDEGIWFFIRGKYLAMGNSRAIENCWRNLYP